MDIQMKTAFAAILICFLAVCPASRADYFAVDVNSDAHDLAPGDGVCAADDFSGCSLRAAIEEANSRPGPDTIEITAAVTSVALTEGALIVTDDGTHVFGSTGRPILDGFANLAGSPILILQSDSNVISALTVKRSRGDGVLITGRGNLIGGAAEIDCVFFLQNGLDPVSSAAVRLRGVTAMGNRILGCTIGTDEAGDQAFGNQHGVIIEQEASDNIIATCLISGNAGWGVMVRSGAHDNAIRESVVGLDRSGLNALPNGRGGIEISAAARDNVIGSATAPLKTFVSANGGDGVSVRGPDCTGNRIVGTVIGLDMSAVTSLGNIGTGVHFSEGCHGNTVGGRLPEERNLIGGNWLDGVLMENSGTSENSVIGNWIGIAANAFRARSNGLVAGNGITVRNQASRNDIGGPDPGERNIIGGEQHHAILLSGTGTSQNRVRGNFIGLNPTGQYSFYIGTGVVMRDGASHNVIGGSAPGERNCISGSANEEYPYGGGVMLYGDGTSYNVVQGNYIGLDSSGTRLAPNATAGVVLGSGASFNTVGGDQPGQGNVISGNGYGTLMPGLGRGVHIEGNGTSFNIVAGNFIGTTADGSSGLRNFGHGIAVVAGASDNLIGGDLPYGGNTIAFNRYHGVFIDGAGTSRNTVRQNSFFRNDSAAIFIAGNAQREVQPPVILSAIAGGLRTIAGAAIGSDGVVQIYRAAPDYTGAGEPKTYLGSAGVRSDGSWYRDGLYFEIGDTLTAMYTEAEGNSSMCAQNYVVSIESEVDENPGALPLRLALQQNYPNPFNPATEIAFSLPTATRISLTVFNLLGQRMAVLAEGQYPAGEYRVRWDGVDDSGGAAASGVYFYRLTTSSGTLARKMLLLR